MNWFKKKKDDVTQAPPAPAKAMAVSDYLTQERIHFFGNGAMKDAILSDLVKSLPYSKPEMALKAIQQRESMGATVLENGISVPHARMVDVPEIEAALGICPSGIQESGQTVNLFILFLGPSNYMKKNLDFLAAISALFQTEGIIPALLASNDPQSAMTKIREAEKR